MVKDNQAVGVQVCKASSWESKKNNGEKADVVDVFAPVIINAAGIHNLYNNLLSQDLPIVKEFMRSNKTIPSFGHNYLFVAIEGMLHNVLVRNDFVFYIFE